jgi:hypothetical protein
VDEDLIHGGAMRFSSTSKAEKSSYDLYYVGATKVI